MIYRILQLNRISFNRVGNFFEKENKQGGNAHQGPESRGFLENSRLLKIF